jgi:S-disulfanyl-L-cysteine oxidoreductase SoxD
MKLRVALICFFSVAAAKFTATGLFQSPVRQTVWDGIYAAEQAARGEQSYKERCARCHGAQLEGTQGNGLVGSDFMNRWREDSMASLYEFVSRNMPPAQRGAGRPLISTPTYLDIIAYVLSQNQFPAGPNPLTPEGLDTIYIQHKDGPQPLPNGALVRVAGCLTQTGQLWSVSEATDPLRTRTSETKDFQEFEAAKNQAPGTQTYRLANLGFVAATFKPEAHLGERLLVKGTLVRQDDISRISVLAVRKIADTCH